MFIVQIGNSTTTTKNNEYVYNYYYIYHIKTLYIELSLLKIQPKNTKNLDDKNIIWSGLRANICDIDYNHIYHYYLPTHPHPRLRWRLRRTATSINLPNPACVSFDQSTTATAFACRCCAIRWSAENYRNVLFRCPTARLQLIKL